MQAELRYHPYAEDLQADPYGLYARLRHEAPLYEDPQGRFVALSRYEDVHWAVQDWRRFSSADGITLEGLPPDVEPEMITMDPPRHDDLRSLVKRAFSPRRTAMLAEAIAEHARRIVCQLDPGDIDLVRDAATVLPATVIAELLGVPPSDHLLFRSWADALIQRNLTVPETLERAREASRQLGAYLGTLIEERRRVPADDLVGTLVEAEAAGAALGHDELLGFCRLLLVAGNETTSHLIGNALVALGRHPDERRKVLADPMLLPGAIEETLRFDAPVQALARTSTEPFERHGRRVPAGRKVVVVLASANRDERRFLDPDRFVVDRGERAVAGHLAFGHGIHFCLGAALARQEAVSMVGAILDRFPEYELPSDVRIIRSGVVRGPVALPVAAMRRRSS